MLFSVQASLLPKNDFDEDLILKKFIGALEDKKTIESWKTDTQRDDLYFIDLFKGVLSKIRDVLVCIYTEKDTDIKSLILEANMILEKVSYPYFETLNIVKSVKRIILINDNQNTSKDDQLDTKFFIEDFLYKEYDLIYCNLEFAINQVGHIPDANKTTENYKECKNRDHCQNYKSMPIEQNHSFIISFMELSNEMIESILPSNNNTTSYVEAHMGGLIRSRKCTDNEIHLFIREKYTLVCPEDMSQCLKRCKSEQSDFTEFDLQDYMGKVFICSKTTAQVLIMLFHFFSETKKRNTKYEIIMKEDNEYQIKWSLSKQVFNKEIVNFWKEQEILDFANNKIIHKFGETMVCNCRYSTNRSDYLANKQKVDNRHLKNFKKRNPSFENTIEELENKLKHLKNEFNQAFYDEMNLVVEIETKPFKTKLFLFSCGHQILFKKLARFIYRSWYNNYLKPLKCPYYCGCGPIHIIGWYEAIVYKIK